MRSLLIVVMLAWSAPLAAAEEPHPDWRLVANSTSIVVGKLYVPVDVIEETLRAGERRYVPMFIEPEQVLAGDDRPKFDVRYFIDGDRTYGLTAEVVMAANAHRILAFLEEGSDGNLYLNGNELRNPDAADLEAVAREIARQRVVVEEWTPDPRAPHLQEVMRLIDRAAAAGAFQDAAFAQLEALGLDAAPAIISVMDDRRPLHKQHIQLVNKSPDAFEGIRHYGPDQMVDALTAVLNQITGERFGGFIYNGASDEERDRTVRAWRIYADYLEQQER